MEDEIRKLLRENLELSRKTSKEVHKIHRMLFWRKIFGVIKWGFIIIFLVISFWQIQPYLGTILNVYQGLLGPFSETKNLPQRLQNLLPK